MLTNYKFWFKTAAWALLVTGLLHSLSLLNKPVGENDSERQMIDLMTTLVLGGVNRTMYELYFFFSLSMSLFTLFAAVLNLMFARYYMPSAHERKFIAASLVFWTIFLVPLILLTFIVPVVCYALCWFFFLLAYWFSGKRP
ncbi:MAG: hypothetical protein IT260_18510 [Saprospiraceae bacterium]|nr:hypothetical protein [Saprospiraceae bacterium]